MASRSSGQVINRGRRTWLVRIYLGEDPITKKRKYHNHTVKGTKRDAQAYLTAALREKDLGRFSGPTKMTVNEYLQKWLKDAARLKLRERSFNDYTDIIRRYLTDTVGSSRMDRLTALEIQALYARLVAERGLAQATLRKVHVVLSSALDQAVRWGLLPFNPSRSVELPRDMERAEKKLKAMTREEVNRFLAAAREDRWYRLFLFALATGMRPAEYLALQWPDVDWEGRRVSVQRTLFRPKGGGWRFDAPKTRCSRRSILLPDTVVAELWRHQAVQIESAGDDHEDNQLVFATETGQPLDAANLRKRHFAKILQAAGIDERFTLYSLRHTHTSLLIADGVSVKTVSSRLGHASVRLTLDVYSHVMPTMQEEAADRLDALLFPVDSQSRSARLSSAPS